LSKTLNISQPCNAEPQPQRFRYLPRWCNATIHR
jgi:hypothetical protein